MIGSFSELARILTDISVSAAEPLDTPMIDGQHVIALRPQLAEDIAHATGLTDEDDLYE